MDIRLHSYSEIAVALAEDPELCNALIQDPALPAEQQVTMLWQAAAFGEAGMLRLMCQQPGANVNVQRASDGVSALYVATQNGRDECCRILLDYKAQVNIQRRTRATPLFIAVQKDRSSIVQLLLDNGADQSIANDQGATPFVLACNMGLTSIAMILARRGADMSDRATGLSGLGWCRREGRVETLRALQMAYFVVPQSELRERVALRMHFLRWVRFPAVVQAQREAVLCGGPLPSFDSLKDLGCEINASFIVPAISCEGGRQGVGYLPPGDRELTHVPSALLPAEISFSADDVEKKVNHVLELLRRDKL